MTTIASPDLTTRQCTVAQLLAGTGYHARNVHTVISDKPLPDCEWCACEPPNPANCELFYDSGSVLSCRSCLFTAASVAAENSVHGEFSLEITEQPAKHEYVTEVGVTDGYGAFVLRDGDEWARYFVDLDALGGGSSDSA